MIVRAPRKEANFYVLDKAISEDRRLSWGARGLLIFLLGKPDNWQVSPAALVNETADTPRPAGRDLVYGLLGELRAAGYLWSEQQRTEGGLMGPTRYLVSESPHTAQPDTAPHTAQPHPVNPTQTRTDPKQELTEKKRAREKVTLVENESGLIEFQVPELAKESFAKAYPGVAIDTEIRKAEAWVNQNLSRRPRSQAGRFLNSWLSRAHGDLRGPQLRVVGGRKASGKQAQRDEMNDWLFGDTPASVNTTEGDPNVIDVVATRVQ